MGLIAGILFFAGTMALGSVILSLLPLIIITLVVIGLIVLGFNVLFNLAKGKRDVQYFNVPEAEKIYRWKGPPKGSIGFVPIYKYVERTGTMEEWNESLRRPDVSSP